MSRGAFFSFCDGYYNPDGIPADEPPESGVSVLPHEATYSQHSSVVCSPDVQLRAVPYDLAIGRNVAFKDEAFWKKLLYLADWRRPENSDDDTKGYYTEGILPVQFKKMMNKPETGEKPMREIQSVSYR